MTKTALSEQSYRRDLGDGLVLRWSTAADYERIAALYSHVFRDSAEDAPNTPLAIWTRDLMSGRHPLITAEDFAVVEDTGRDEIVAATCLLGQTIEYDGIALPFGRPEIVASLPEYRNRGLVRAVFELIHARSEDRGDILQGITGIPYYYRQFGYEYALELGGARRMLASAVPKLKEGEAEPYTLRDGTEADLPQVIALYDRDRTRLHNNAPLLVSTPMGAEYWLHTIQGQTVESGEGWRTQLIVGGDGRTAGYVLTKRMLWDDTTWVVGIGVDRDVSLVAVLPSVQRALLAQAATILKRRPDVPDTARIGFSLGSAHPLYEAIGNNTLTFVDRPYAWYIRVADLPAFIRQIAPALERRLAESMMVGYTGELRLTFYRDGLRLVFEHGRLITAEPWRRDHNWGPGAQAGFPPLVFLQVLFGYRTIDELHTVLPDVWADDHGRRMIEALFPKRHSWVLHLD